MLRLQMITEISCEIGYNIYKEGESMAILSMFYGIIISMYYMDNRQHHVPVNGIIKYSDFGRWKSNDFGE